MSEPLARSEIVAQAIAIHMGIVRGEGKPRATAKEIHAAMGEIDTLHLRPEITPREERYLRDLLETFGGMHACWEEREAPAALHEQLRQKLRQRRQQRRQSKP